MQLFFKAAAAVLIAVVLSLALGKEGKDFGLLLCMCVCVMVLVLGMTFLEPVLDFLYRLEELGNLDSGMVSILLKVVGISILTETAAVICADAGNGSLGKALHILAAAVILWLSIPIFEGLLDLIQKILGEV